MLDCSGISLEEDLRVVFLVYGRSNRLDGRCIWMGAMHGGLVGKLVLQTKVSIAF